MRVHHFTPPGYHDGAFVLVVELTPEEEAIVAGAPAIAFEIPKLPQRAVYSDHGYDAVAIVNGAPELRGVLNREGWFGHCYTNGVEEAQNRTPIGDVVAALEGSVKGALDLMRQWVDAARGRN